MDQFRCPDCGCRLSDHNAVNRIPDGFIAHCGHCGACWKSLRDNFVELLWSRLAPGSEMLDELGKGKGEA